MVVAGLMPLMGSLTEVRCLHLRVKLRWSQLRVRAQVDVYRNNIGSDGAEAIAVALKANDSCVLKKLRVDDGLENHQGLKSACQLRGVELE